MRKLLLSLLFLPLLVSAQQLPVPPALAAKAWLLLEVGSGQALVAERADERIDPASLTKLMTAYLSFSAIRQKTLALDGSVQVSERAWKAPGSRMFVEPGKPVVVDDLLKGMIVQSGNDASVALAEAVGGSEDNFAQMMNREAQRLGMKSTRFANATGLTDPNHYSTARDLATLAAALIRDFPDEYGRYYAMREFRYGKITQPNRNRLLWIDPTVDGVKTGHTDAAGYCLIASAKRGQRRLLSVVLGADSDAARAQESLKLLNWGFQAYDAVLLYAAAKPVTRLRIWKGDADEVSVGFPADFIVPVPKGLAPRLRAEVVSQQPLLAPVSRGQRIATLRLLLDGKPWGDYPLSALDAVAPGSLLGRGFDALRLLFK